MRPMKQGKRHHRPAGYAATLALAMALLVALAGCGEMADQASFQRQEEPRTIPAGSVPVTGLAMVYDEAAARALTNPFDQSPAVLETGQRLYNTYCRMCHGESGAGDGAIAYAFPPQPRSLVDERSRGLSDGDLFWTITNGFGRMPAFEKRLTVDERWHIVSHVRSLQR